MIKFNSSPEPTIGVEIELQLVDNKSLNLNNISQKVLTEVKKEFLDNIKCELIESMIEINTNICSNIDEVEKDIKKTLTYLNDILKNFSVDKKKMLQLAESGFITETDLADYMVKELNYPFRKAYSQTAKIINFAEKNKKKLIDLNIEEINRIEPKLNKDVFKIFDLKNSINSTIK